ncbi:MAG TPA: ATP-binding protein [Acidimicrobiales bacterium]|nr:ATP-binding protein [Acidimicrobiales bacterium]|tara:strand:+ start:2435 stop:2881 length:447 start_codon:yes stop_codon:yes gene_type:complete
MNRKDYSSGMVELRIPAQAEYIQLVRTVIGEVASINPNLNLGRIADLRLAVSEAVTNAYREHTRQNIEDQIVIRCDLSKGKIEIEINDQGSGFNPDQIPSLPNPEDPNRLNHESGVGFSLIQELSDETVVEVGEHGTKVRLIFNLNDA